MIYGYARVSTKKQNLDSQLLQLKKYGCEKIFAEKVTGDYTKRKKREAWDSLYALLKSGDTLVVTKLDRLGRTLIEVISILRDISDKQIRFVSLSENHDTSTPSGRALVHMAAVFAELERDINSERTKEGLLAAKAQGRVGGRPKISKLTIAKMYTMYHCHCYTVRDICDECHVSKQTLYRYLNYYANNPRELPDLSLYPLLPAEERPEAPAYQKKGRPAITSEVIAKIQTAYKANISKSEISRGLGLSYATVSKYCENKTDTKELLANDKKVSD